MSQVAEEYVEGEEGMMMEVDDAMTTGGNKTKLSSITTA